MCPQKFLAAENILIKILMLLFLLNICNEISAETITIAAVNIPYYNFRESGEDEISGISIDLIEEACKGSDIDVSFNLVPMSRVRWAVFEKKCDAFVGASQLFSNEEGGDIIPLLRTKLVFFYKKDKFPDGVKYNVLSDLNNLKIGDLRGTPLLPLFERMGMKIEFANEIVQNFKKLEADRLDLIVCTDLTGYQILNDFFQDSIDDFDMTEEPLCIIDDGIILLHENKEIFKKLEAGLFKIKKNGIYNKIIDKYF